MVNVAPIGEFVQPSGHEIQTKRPLQWHQKFLAFTRIFLRSSTIHGFAYLSKAGLDIAERLIWLFCICTAIGAIVSLGQRTWIRYQTSPMVISMDRNKFSWNTSFPSLTICPHKRIDDGKLEKYFGENSDQFDTDAKRDEFRNFIVALASASFETFETVPKNNTFNIRSKDYLSLIKNLTWLFEPEISSGTTFTMYLQETITELGICYSVNTKLAYYNSYSYWQQNRWDLIKQNDTVKVHPLDGEIYSQAINLSTSYDVFFHGALEVPDIYRRKYSFGSADYTTIELSALEIITSTGAKDLKVSQRKCRFTHENEQLTSSPVYSFNLCKAECRLKFAHRICHCVPHFYRSMGRDGVYYSICDFAGMECLSQIKDELISLKSTKYKIDCNCLPNCDDSNFFVQSTRSRFWFLGSNLQWGINNYPKMQLKRDLIFGFTDVLVYIGGIVGLFLGCSLLSIGEVFYYFTVRLYRHMFKSAV